MAQKTIPELSEATTFDENALFPIDSGIQTFKVTAPHVYKALKQFGPIDVQTKAVDYDMVFTDKLVRASGAHTIGLPDGDNCQPGDEFIVKKTDSGTTTTIDCPGGETMDGETSLTLTEQYGFYRFMFNGTNYDIVAWG
jgi:hypothetical protein